VCTPPRQGGNLGAWLQIVVARLCFQHRRMERRREARERAAARPEALAPTIDVVARRETIHAVTAAVFALEEPYQSTLLLRYFEDLAPAAIARRTETNLATVKSRLQRGLLLLRARLDGTAPRRSWQRALCGTFGIAPFTAAAATLSGVLLMQTSTKLLLGGATVVAASFVLLLWSAAADPQAAPRAHVQSAVAPVATEVAAEPEAPPTARTEVPADEPTAPLLAHPFAFDLQIELRDRDGLPVPDTQVFVAPIGCSFAKVPVLTDATGVVHAIWYGKQSSMEMAVLVGDRPMRRVTVAAGSPRRLVLEGRRQQQGGVRFYSRLDRGWLLSVAISDTSGKQGGNLELLANWVVTDDRSATSDLQMQPGLHPFAVFGDRLVRPAGAAPEQARSTVLSGLPLLRRMEAQGLTVTDAVVTTRPSAPKGDEPPPTIVEGIVWDELGKPVPRATVCFGTAVDVPASVARTDDQGRFRFENVLPGQVELRAGGRDQGLARARVQVAAGQTTTWQARLVREAILRGRVIGVGGKQLAGCTVEAEGAAPWFDACCVRDDGTFELPNQPGGPARLYLYQEKSRLPVAVLGSALPDCGELAFRLDASTIQGLLQIQPVASVELESVQVEVRVWQEETGRGALMDKGENGAFGLSGLCAGFYRVEVGGSAVGWIDAGRHWVDGTGPVDLGRIELPRPGRVRVVYGEDPVADGERCAQQVCQRRKDCDVRVVDEAEAKKPDLVLPAGGYLLLWRDRAGSRHVREFAVQKDQTTVVDARAAAHGR
jgi:hypothetical protein